MPGYRFKRLVDILGASLLLVAAAPVMLAVAVAVRATSRGPVVFRQRRLGRGERTFTILKFRSMRIDAPHTGPRFTAAGDARITRVGRLIRKTSLDELPQLVNVLRGEMSLIGPRPYVGFELDRCPAEDRARRASVRPGLSGLAQVSGRSGLSPEEALRRDLQYVHECSLWLDLKLMLKTATTILRRGTAN